MAITLPKFFLPYYFTPRRKEREAKINLPKSRKNLIFQDP